MSSISLNTFVSNAYDEITATPYYQDGEMYKFASHLLNDEETISHVRLLYQASEEYDNDTELSESVTAIKSALEQLQNIEIHRSDFDKWILQRILAGSMEEHRDILDMLLAELNLIAYTSSHSYFNEPEYDEEESITRISYNGNVHMVVDYDNLREEETNHQTSSDEYVLNRKNPFADVSIKDQRFIYASDYGRFNALELNTSHTLTKTSKDEDRDFVVLQPGFKIRNSPRLDRGVVSDISFDNTLTTEITQDDDKTYVYLDIKDIIAG